MSSREPVKGDVGAVVVAAGSGSRMGFDKMLADIEGVPVIARTLLAMDSCPVILEVVLVAAEEKISAMRDIVLKYGIKKTAGIVAGGKTRQQSVHRGVRELKDGARYIAVHDGARPFITAEVFERCAALARKTGAAAAAVPLKDTVKQTDGENDYIVLTPPRELLYLAQTPQIFERELYLSALKEAGRLGGDYTDDCQLVEAVGRRVYLCEGDERNIKITTPFDMLLASAIVKAAGFDTGLPKGE